MFEKKANECVARLSTVEAELGNPEVVQDQKRFRELTQEHSYLTQVKSVWDTIVDLESQLKGNRELLKSEEDEEFLSMLNDDIAVLEKSLEQAQSKMESLLIPPDPNDNAPTILEVRAGTGGDEAALFVGDCVRMFKLYADSMKWRVELLSSTPSEAGGFKEYVMVVTGPGVHRFLQYEAGTHRVQRVPETEAQGRIHTSAITVAVLMEPNDDEEVKIDDKDLRFDTYRASGAGGQHVNTTDSAVRITHVPSGTVVQCQDERSQHKNRDKAMRFLKAKLAELERQKKMDEISATRSSQVGSGDRSERIRTYNFPQNRLTDHRINLTRYDLDKVMEGGLEEISGALVAHFYQEKLNA